MPWNLALLGSSHDALELAHAAARDPRFRVASWYLDAPRDERQLLAAAPQATPLDDWQSLLAGDAVQAVVVSPVDGLPEGQDADIRQEQLRRLAQEGMPLLLIQPACEAILAFELDMIRSDTQRPLLAYTAGEGHPAVAELAAILAAGEQSVVGAAEQLLLERRLVDRSRARVLAALVRDAAVLRQAAGAAVNVSATAVDRDSLGSLNVTLTTATGLLARWAVSPAQGGDEGRLVLVGSRGRAVLSMPADGQPWGLKVSGSPPAERSFPYNAAQAGLDRLAAALEAEEQPAEEPSTNWPEACRDLEVAATVDESLRRGRTIPIHGETASEEQTFKGMMAVGGCAVILLLLAGTLVWAVVEGIRLAHHTSETPSENGTLQERRQPTPANTTPLLVRLWPVYPLALFLLLQLLWLVFLDRPRRKAAAKSPGDASRGPPAGRA